MTVELCAITPHRVAKRDNGDITEVLPGTAAVVAPIGKLKARLRNPGTHRAPRRNSGEPVKSSSVFAGHC